MGQSVVGRWRVGRVAGIFRSLVDARNKALLAPVLMYGSEIMLWKRRYLELELYRWTTLEVC